LGGCSEWRLRGGKSGSCESRDSTTKDAATTRISPTAKAQVRGGRH
jgi:hypothetical protein